MKKCFHFFFCSCSLWMVTGMKKKLIIAYINNYYVVWVQKEISRWILIIVHVFQSGLRINRNAKMPLIALCSGHNFIMTSESPFKIVCYLLFIVYLKEKKYNDLIFASLRNEEKNSVIWDNKCKCVIDNSLMFIAEKIWTLSQSINWIDLEKKIQ